MLLRLLTVGGLACGLLFSAEQQFPTGGFPALPLSGKLPNSLPMPLSSAIQNMVTGKWPAQKPLVRLDELPPVMTLARQCSIPLEEYKPPASVQFFIQQVPIPKDAPDVGRMPVMRAPICGEPPSPGAH